MVGYNPDLKISKDEQAFAGALSNSIARAITQPFDVLKIRFQLQVEPISKGSNSGKYHGILQAVQCMVKEEGYRVLWKGHVPAQVLSVGFGVVEFTCFEQLSKAAWFTLPEETNRRYKPIIHGICGSMSSCMATLMVQPIDVIRTRFVAQGEPKIYTSVFHATKSIYRTDGVIGFYRGLIPACLGVAPQLGLQFGFYALLQSFYKQLFHLPQGHHPGTVESFVCGSGSGFLSKLIIYPLDLSKKRLQIQGFEEARKQFGAVRQYRGLVHCMTDLVKTEGFLALYKGLSPSLLKAVFATGTIFCVYDQVCYLFWLKNRLGPG